MSALAREANIGERFLKDVAEHQMTVHVADGPVRHITFRKSGTFTYAFHVTTWPGYLCISGDMGSFVFSRLHDMFEFFRGAQINSGYWAEKLTAHDRHGGHRTFSNELYREAVADAFKRWSFEGEEQRDRSWNYIACDWDGILGAESREEAYRAAVEWQCPVTKQRFRDFWDYSLEEYSLQFIWCCHAIQWAIARFDGATLPRREEVAA